MNTLLAVTSGVNGFIRISEKFTDDYLLFAITDLNDNGTWWTLDVANSGSSATSPFGNGNDIVISLVATGDKGDKGDTGEKGQKGEIGVKGETGAKGQKVK